MRYLKAINEANGLPLADHLKKRADARHKIIDKAKEVLYSFDENFIDLNEIDGFTYNFMFSKGFNYETRLRKFNTIQEVNETQVDIMSTSIVLFIDSNISTPSFIDVQDITEFNMMDIGNFEERLQEIIQFTKLYNDVKVKIAENISRLEQYDIKFINPKFTDNPLQIANISSKLKFIICLELFEHSVY